MTAVPRAWTAAGAFRNNAFTNLSIKSSSGWDACWLSAAAILVVAVPFFAYTNVVLNHFYLQGAYFWDSGLDAGIIWRHDAWLTYPPLWPIGSQYAYHVMPLLSFFTVASFYLPVSLPGWFALMIGLGHALPSIGVFWLLTEGLGLRSGRGLALSVVLAIGIAFTGVPLATILFPHLEIMLAGGLILFCSAVALQHIGLAFVFLVFTLAIREDAGFHAFGILFLLCTENRRRGRPWREQRPIIILGALSFAYSVGAFLLKQALFPDQPPVFASEYLGNPPFANVSLHGVLLNFMGLPIYRGYFFWPAIAAVAWAIWSRNALIALGYLAVSPWLLLHVMANRDILTTLSGYYSFPFLVACVWPLAAIIIDARQRGVRPDAIASLAGFTAMLALSFVGLSNLWNPGHMDLWKNFSTFPSLAREHVTDRTVRLLLADQTSGDGSPFGTIFIDQSIYSFAPYSFNAETVVRPVEHTAPTHGLPIDTFAYFESGPDIERVRDTSVMKDLTHAYRFKDTSIRLVSNRELDSVIGLERVPPDSPVRQ